jgi:PIN domain nuclease of toxin-antitoxin system
VRVVADTHAFYWYYRQPQLLSGVALATLHTDLVGGDGVVVSVATYMDLWYLVRKGSLPSVALSHVWSLTQYPRHQRHCYSCHRSDCRAIDVGADRLAG